MDTPRRRPMDQLRTNLTRSGGCGPPWPSSTTDAHRILVGPRRDTQGIPPSRRRSDNERRGSSMTIRRRESKDGPRFDVEWRLPDRTKRSKTFKSEREARVFEASLVTTFAGGDIVDPRAGRVTLAAVYRTWLASRLDLSPKVRRGYEDNWRNRIEPRFGEWHIARIDHQSIQAWVNDMVESGLSPRTVRWVHSVLKMSLDYAIDDGLLPARNPAARTKFPPQRHTSHTYLSTGGGRGTSRRLRRSGRRRRTAGLHRSAIRRAGRPARRRRRS